MSRLRPFDIDQCGPGERCAACVTELWCFEYPERVSWPMRPEDSTDTPRRYPPARKSRRHPTKVDGKPVWTRADAQQFLHPHIPPGTLRHLLATLTVRGEWPVATGQTARLYWVEDIMAVHKDWAIRNGLLTDQE
jgi:hypothetical protein